MRRTARVLATAGALAVLSVASVARAQDGAAASDPAPSSAKLELARQLVQAMGGQEDAEDQLDAVFDVIEKTVQGGAARVDNRISGAFLDSLKQQVSGLAPQVVALSVQLYAQNCTEKELRDMLAFQQSDTGRAMARKQPLIRAQALHQTLPLVSGKLPDLLDHAADQACARVQCSADERKALGNLMNDPPQPPAQATPPDDSGPPDPGERPTAPPIAGPERSPI